MLKRCIAAAFMTALAAGSSAALAQAADNCADAPTVGTGTFTGNTSTATNDGRASCVSSASPDMWLRFVPAEDGLLVASTCGGATFDTVLSVHSGCPGLGANAIICNDDACGLQSTVRTPVVAGQAYLIRIGGFGVSSVGAFSVSLQLEEPPPPPTDGPDVILADLIGIAYYASVGGINSYAIGTTSCNIGDAPISWISSTNLHPVIGQNVYRLKDGRFEQIGMSWLKHGFVSVNGNFCGSCVPPPMGGSQLGVNCSDPYSASLNGSQSNLGPRSQVNAATGYFPYPFTAPGYSGEIARRVQIAASDVNPALNPGAIYFAEGQYVTQDDAQWNNGLNNNAYRRVSFNTPSAPAFTAATRREAPAIHAWREVDSTVTLVNFDSTEANVAPFTDPIVTRFVLGVKVTANNDDSYTYEYAIQNINSHRSGGSFTVPMPVGASVWDVGFHSVNHHSGEPYSIAPWTFEQNTYDITWRTESFAANPNANALRWGTMYNFRFTTSVPPSDAALSLGLFRPGTPASIDESAPGPSLLHACWIDFNGDGGVDGADVEAFYLAWELGIGQADVNQDGGVDGQDVETFFINWEAGSC
ncbi:MAG: hypothetical protein KF859_05970 [Phycisphaeraceae bacterium]|nr:hypothetical protein [Phycisphaeraceae bacterium]